MKKILAIDDSEINLGLLYQICNMHYPEFKFLKAASGREGIDIAIEEKPDIILLDIIMPELNGYEVCEYLKNNEETNNIPIIMISALGHNSEERTKGLNVGADAFISKPFDRNELRAQINVALRIKRVEDLLRRQNKSLELTIKDQTQKYLHNEERFLQISAHAMEFYWEIDSKGIFTYVSPVIENILSVKPDEIVGEKNYMDFFQINQSKAVKNGIEESFNNRNSFKNKEVAIKKEKDGKIWLLVSGFSVYNNNKEFHGFRGVCYDITERKQAEITLKKNVKQIKLYQQKLKRLNNELTLVEERERRRIAENLHDSLGQTLSMAYMQLSSITDINFTEKVNKVISYTSELLNKAISESRTLTYDLSPPILYELGLMATFKWKLDQVQQQHGIATILSGENQKIEIQKEFNIFLYRIVNELIANVIKHAKASRIELKIQKGKKYYYITVTDDGIGLKQKFDKKNLTKRGYGLLSIAERLDTIKGQFRLESNKGEGTKAIVAIPFIDN